METSAHSVELLGRIVQVRADDWTGDFPPRPFFGTVTGQTVDAIAIRLETSLTLKERIEAAHLVAKVRHDDGLGLSKMHAGHLTVCNLTLVPIAKFNPGNPCDLSWWRGNGAAVGDVKIVHNHPSSTAASFAWVHGYPDGRHASMTDLR